MLNKHLLGETMKNIAISKLLVSILAGGFLGWIGARVLFVGSWLSLIPWGIVGMLLGLWSQKPEWLVNGVCYGFAEVFVFMIAGYAGSAPIISRLPFFAILGLFGAFCGLILGWLGFAVKTILIRRQPG